MAVVVEDGTGTNAAANAYVDVATCDAYHADRGNAAWAALSPTAKASAVIKAADYLNVAYRWRGEKLLEVQPLEWPRSFAYPLATYVYSGLVNIVPPEVKRANMELALLASTGDLLPSTTGQRIRTESKSIAGAISSSKSYSMGGGYATDRRFPFVDRMLSKIASGGSTGTMSARVERA